eukprot:7877390-Pyramimonas_sp.AAC.1
MELAILASISRSWRGLRAAVASTPAPLLSLLVTPRSSSPSSFSSSSSSSATSSASPSASLLLF